MTAKPPVFETVAEALAALKRDKLGSVYYRAGQVFVATAYGTGTFSYGREQPEERDTVKRKKLSKRLIGYE